MKYFVLLNLKDDNFSTIIEVHAEYFDVLPDGRLVFMNDKLVRNKRKAKITEVFEANEWISFYEEVKL